ncbi:hypothetical protein GSH19_02920 [Lactobacillus sp. S2-2]|uniref:hypothetical protein n=1 Tax=Lactobacillus sp. S2-2 TaxID=2692917 RepID=UPI001F3F7355|nr:hypothetical protein [Lactobacillus sp. S2-2]MCF6515117.1 hypothetical protein [Lactobacillus sp. S2-2]
MDGGIIIINLDEIGVKVVNQNIKEEQINNVKSSLENLYLILDNDLSILSINNFCIDVNRKKNKSYNLEDNCVKIFIDFILVASRQNWSKGLNFDMDKIYKLSSIKLGNKNYKFNLGIKNMLLKSYYEKNENHFFHAWKMFLKVIVSDFGINLKEIDSLVDNYLDKFEKK